MGAALPKCHAGFDATEVKVVLTGPDAAGRTAVMAELTRGVPAATAQTIGFTVATWEEDDVRFAIWDVGYQKKARRHGQQHYHGAQALIFVVDCSDHGMLKDASEELAALAADVSIKGALVLVVPCNCGAVGAASEAELTQALRLQHLRDLDWRVVTTQASAGDCVNEGMEWLSCAISEKQGRSPTRRGSSFLGRPATAQERQRLGHVGGS